MPRGFGRLPFLNRRRRGSDGPPNGDPLVVETPLDLDSAPLGPPLLLPAMIIRQILFDATELTPAWATARVPASPAVVAAEPAPPPKARKPAARPRRAKSPDPVDQPQAGTPTRRPRKPSSSGPAKP
jgi:hypothetical protein